MPPGTILVQPVEVLASTLREGKKIKKSGGKKERNGNYLNFVWYILYQLYVNKAVKKTFCLDPGLT